MKGKFSRQTSAQVGKYFGSICLLFWYSSDFVLLGEALQLEDDDFSQASHWYIVPPNALHKAIWDWMMMVIVLYNASFVPGDLLLHVSPFFFSI